MVLRLRVSCSMRRRYRSGVDHLGKWATTTFRAASGAGNTLLPGHTTTRCVLENRFRLAVDAEFDLIPSQRNAVAVINSKSGFGDYQCNAALVLARTAKQSPVEVARRITSRIQTEGVIADLTITGGGFVNIRLCDDYLADRLLAMLRDSSGRLGVPVVPAQQAKRIVVDFSSPNIAKEMHVGHLRSTIIGDCISRVYEFIGHDVLRFNHVGDWGTQFGMLIHFLKSQRPDICQEVLNSDSSNKTLSASIGEISTFYKAARQAFEENKDNFQEKSRAEVVLLQRNDIDSMKFWHFFCSLSRRDFQKNYDLLGISVIERGESFYNPLLNDMVNDLLIYGQAKISDGAVVIAVPNSGAGGSKTVKKHDGTTHIMGKSDGDPVVIIRKSDGGYLYSTTDLAALKYRLAPQGDNGKCTRIADPGNGDGADVVLYVTDSGQAIHFERLFGAAEICGMLGENKLVKHVPFGVVLGADGKKLKSRSGDTIRLSDLINDAVLHAGRTLQGRRSSQDITQTSEVNPIHETERIREQSLRLGVASVKYADLSVKRESDYKFSPQKMTSLAGNTAPYMLYVVVRIRSILRRIDGLTDRESVRHKCNALQSIGDIKFNTAERCLAIKIAQFDDVLFNFADDLYPHKICDYIYELSQLFNAFYETCPVLNAETEQKRDLRIVLCFLTENVLSLFLNHILGIGTVDNM